MLCGGDGECVDFDDVGIGIGIGSNSNVDDSGLVHSASGVDVDDGSNGDIVGGNDANSDNIDDDNDNDGTSCSGGRGGGGGL